MKSMEDRDGFIWVDGAFVPWRDAKAHLLAYTFQCGAGVFEGLRCYAGASGPAIFRLREHTQRFIDSARIIRMPLPFDRERINAAHLEVIRANGLGACYIRTLGYYDGHGVGVSSLSKNNVHVAIAAWEWNDYLGAGAQQEGIRVKTSSFSRLHVNSMLSKAKANGHYINSMLSSIEARQCGFQDALMLDTNGYVAECSTSNIFVVRHGRIVTPDVTAILEGITRDTVITLARERGIEVTERRVTRDELYRADELFMTGTAVEVTPIVDVDGCAVGEGRVGAITTLLQKAYFDAANGYDSGKREWLTPLGNCAIHAGVGR